jgi:hypothetical protein
MADERALLEAMRRPSCRNLQNGTGGFYSCSWVSFGAATYMTHAHVIETAAPQ